MSQKIWEFKKGVAPLFQRRALRHNSIHKKRLKRPAEAEDDLAVKRQFLQLPTGDLGCVQADEPKRGDILVGRVLIGNEAANHRPIVCFGLGMQVGDVELNMIMAEIAEHKFFLDEMLRHGDDESARWRLRWGLRRGGRLGKCRTGGEQDYKRSDHIFHCRTIMARKRFARNLDRL